LIETVLTSTAPSGRQVEIGSGEQRAWIVEVGGGLRAYSARGRELLDGYSADEMCSSARGQCLVPWPNRIRDGRYEFAGLQQQLALTEPERQDAIHGLARWANWRVAEQGGENVTMEYLLHPQPGIRTRCSSRLSIASMPTVSWFARRRRTWARTRVRTVRVRIPI